MYRSIDKGYRWNKETKKLEYKDEWKAEDIANNMPDDLRTCNLLLQMMNSLHPDIQFTGDVPSKYPNNRVPMLDLQVGVVYIKETINKDESTVSSEETPKLVPENELSENEIAYEQVKWEFFKKSMAAKQMLRADSAMPDKIKRTNTVQELMRRVTNITPNLPSTRKDIINVTNAYMETMQCSGYNEAWRRDTVIAAMKGVRNKQEIEAKGVRKVYRLQEDGAKDRHNRKITMNTNWFKSRKKENNHQIAPTQYDNFKQLRPPPKWLSNKEKHDLENKDKDRPYEGVVFIPYTEGGKLRKELQDVDDEMTKMMQMNKTKFVERAGTKLFDILCTKDPFYELEGGCKRIHCQICITQG